MNKSVLIEKRKNLLGNNKSTPELFLNSYFIDLIELFPKDELLNFVENQAITEIKINKLELTNKITTIINDANDEESLINAFNLLQANQFSGIKDKTKLIQMIINHKLDLIENLLEYALKSKLEYYDSSIWTLYCSYGLLEGPVRFINHDPLVLRAPLINLEIEIYKNEQAEIVFKKINEQLVSNDILEIFLDDQLEKFTLISEAINKDVFNANEYFEYFKKILPDLILEEDYVPIKKTSFESVTNAQSLKIHKSFFVSLISPVGGKMLRDYNDVLTSDYQFPVYDTIFHKNLNHLIYDNDEIYEINNPLNLVQKLAVINSQNKNTLIYGPPGTGKSEVVANLIANLLINNKNVVVISEKKAALDVLDSRLSSLNVLVMSTFDGQNNNAFYEKIIQLNHLLVGINKVNLKLNNQDYLNLLKYQNLFNSLVKYVDINGKNVYQILQTYDQINLDTYSKNIDLIKFICNKLSVEKITLSQLIKDVKLLKEIYTIYTNFFKEENISVNAYNYSRANEFLDTFNQVIDKERPYVITAFICEDKILKHKPLFRLRDKLIQTSDVEVLADTFRKIVNSKLKYIVNFQKIYNFVSSNNLASGYISLYD
jgi:Cdc6-like AAA superfamily ATPase